MRSSPTLVVYGATVKDVLGSFGVTPAAGAYLSAKPDSKVPRKGMDLVVSNPKKLEVVSDGGIRGEGDDQQGCLDRTRIGAADGQVQWHRLDWRETLARVRRAFRR